MLGVRKCPNYLSALKTKLLIFGLDVAGFADVHLKYYQEAVQMHAPRTVNLKKLLIFHC